MNNDFHSRDFLNLSNLVRELIQVNRDTARNSTTFNINYYENRVLEAESENNSETRSVNSRENSRRENHDISLDETSRNERGNSIPERQNRRENFLSNRNIEIGGISLPIPIIRNHTRNIEDLGTINNIIMESINETIENLNNEEHVGDEENTKVSLRDLLNKTTIKNRSNIESDEEKCHICNENYESGDICRVINECNHFYHHKCIDTWFFENNKCPICNQKI